jgi:hypothetical protein
MTTLSGARGSWVGPWTTSEIDATSNDDHMHRDRAASRAEHRRQRWELCDQRHADHRGDHRGPGDGDRLHRRQRQQWHVLVDDHSLIRLR